MSETKKSWEGRNNPPTEEGGGDDHEEPGLSLMTVEESERFDTSILEERLSTPTSIVEERRSDYRHAFSSPSTPKSEGEKLTSTILSLVASMENTIKTRTHLTTGLLNDITRTHLDKLELELTRLSRDSEVVKRRGNPFIQGSLIRPLLHEISVIRRGLNGPRRVRIEEFERMTRVSLQLFNRFHRRKMPTDEFQALVNGVGRSGKDKEEIEEQERLAKQRKLKLYCDEMGEMLKNSGHLSALATYKAKVVPLRPKREKKKDGEAEREDDSGQFRIRELGKQNMTSTRDVWDKQYDEKTRNFMASKNKPDAVTEKVLELLHTDERFREFFYTKNRVIEFGCGNGNDAVKLCSEFPNVVEYMGFDQVQSACETTKRRLEGLNKDDLEVTLKDEDFKLWMLNEAHERSGRKGMPEDERQIIFSKSTLHYDFEEVFRDNILPALADIVHSGNGMLIMALKTPESGTCDDHQNIRTHDGVKMGVHRSEFLLRMFIEQGKLAELMSKAGFDMEEAAIEPVKVEGYDEDGKKEIFTLVMARIKKRDKVINDDDTVAKPSRHPETEGGSDAKKSDLKKAA